MIKASIFEGRIDETARKIKDFWKRYKKNRAATFGVLVVLFLGIVAVFAPYLSPYPPNEIKSEIRFTSPSQEHFMGTDDFGRDVLSRVIWGTRVSMLVGFVSAGISSIAGVLLGSISGYYGGKIDDVIMRITDIMMSLPTFFLTLLIVVFIGSSIWNIMAVIGLTTWASPTRIMRAQFLSVREKEFVEATRALGASDFRIVVNHILPNAIYPLIVRTSLSVGYGIITEASLSFLGLGDATMISWGGMLQRAMSFFRQGWWQIIFPGLGITAAVLAFNFIGDGLNDALNPRLRER